VQCWGSNRYGKLGDGTSTERHTPVQVQPLPAGATAVATGAEHACALIDGSVYCWGSSAEGELGNNNTSSPYMSATPVQVQELSGATAIAAGGDSACALANGNAYCWGYNGHGLLGNNSTTQSALPVQVQLP
jgi:alpha-tubulin suppressor-like RCC1 family protein